MQYCRVGSYLISPGTRVLGKGNDQPKKSFLSHLYTKQPTTSRRYCVVRLGGLSTHLARCAVLHCRKRVVNRRVQEEKKIGVVAFTSSPLCIPPRTGQFSFGADLEGDGCRRSSWFASDSQQSPDPTTSLLSLLRGSTVKVYWAMPLRVSCLDGEGMFVKMVMSRKMKDVALMGR